MNSIYRISITWKGLINLQNTVVRTNKSCGQVLNPVKCLNLLRISSPLGVRQVTSSTSAENDALKKGADAKDEVTETAFVNRNPRNLEMMGIAWRRKGWKFQYPSREYYHRLVFEKTHRKISAYIEHCSGVKVLSVSSSDLALARHLYSQTDVAAARAVGRVLGYQCLQAGIVKVCFQPLYNNPASTKMKVFCDEMVKSGVALEESAEVEPDYMPGIDYDDLEAVNDLERRQWLVYYLGEESATNKELSRQRHCKVRRRLWRKPEKLEMPDYTLQ